MLAAPITRKMRRAANGSALVIVLFFVILLTIVTIAFLTRSLTAVKVSASSAGETKSKMLAGSASDIVIGDLKQEIIAGSASVGTVNWPVYTPSSNLTMIPFQNGIPTSGTAIPNLISRSVSPANTIAGGGSAPAVPYATAPYTGLYTAASIPPNRAASDSSASTTTYATSKVNSTTPSLNGRYVSPAQWNGHYLIPRQTPANPSTTTDATPVTSFVPPDWVVVTRGGATSVSSTTPGFGAVGSNGLNDPTLTNTNYAVGRYAYAIYNEGGLLDMNVAGFPADPTSPGATGSNGLTSIQSGLKSGLALADLTQLSVASTALAQSQINGFVGWRNYASAELSAANGSYPNLSFTPTTAGNWLTNFVLGNTNGFMGITPPVSGVTTPPTDQALLSRQQLISVIESLGISPDFLQYMGTFSRGLDQPSTVPDPNRPKILTTATGQANSPAPPAYNLVDSYTGNNNGEGGDTDPTGINPSFLAIRVPTGWTATRLNGAAFIAGEPLVKTKFALSRLALVTYNYATTFPSVAAAAAANDPVYQRFGLYRTSSSTPWIYNHGQNFIMPLGGATGVTSLTGANGREADFAELLKAAIIAGSLAKGGPNLANGSYNYQYVNDTSLDASVIQIMANLIDQQDTDSYPTAISINGVTLYGVEDLPYFYRYHLMSVVKTLPAPYFSKNLTQAFTAVAADTTTGQLSGITPNEVNYKTGATLASSTSPWTLSNTTVATINGAQQATLTNAGEVWLLYIPDLWNPHDPNNVASSLTNRPTQFRVYAVTDDPAATSPVWNVGAQATLSGSGQNTNAAKPPLTSSITSVIPTTDPLAANSNYYIWPISVPTAFSQATTTMTFSDNSGTLFREPTLLWNNHPTGLSLTTTGTSAGSVKDVNTGITYYGIIAGKSPVSIQATYSSVVTSTGVSDPSPGGWGANTPNTSGKWSGQINGTWVFQGSTVSSLPYLPSASSFQQISFYLQYLDASGNWDTYDVKYPDLHGLNSPPIVADVTDDWSGGQNYNSPLSKGGGDGQLSDQASGMDPRSPRWSVGTSTGLGTGATGNNFLLEPTASSDFTTGATKLAGVSFNVLETNRPRGDTGNQISYSNPCATSDPTYPLPSALGLRNLQMRWFGAGEYRAGSQYNSGSTTASPGNSTSPAEFDGLFTQNNPAIHALTLSQNGTTLDQLYTEDPDGVARPAMAAYTASITDSNTSSLAPATADASRTGLPMATASTISDSGVATATSQSQSRPLILNRPFRSVSEMSYAFRGSPWKNIDFFTPASGDSALLDTFCLTEPPANGMVAGKVDLNTRQIPVLQALEAGAYVDEINNAATTPPSYALPGLTGAEAKNIATTLETITSDTTHAWRGPFKNISALVGRFVSSPGSTTDTDLYTYAPPALSTGGTLPTVNYAGLSSALDCSSFNGVANHVFANSSTPIIQRFRESAIRPLAAAGQVRVWNLLIDVVAQTGHYPKTATGLDQFFVDGQTHLWVHVAIDRYTGQVIDKQVEVVTP